MTEPQDIVTEARELLRDFPEIADAAYNTGLALFADTVERERQSPFFGHSKKVARVYARAPELLRLLADECEKRDRLIVHMYVHSGYTNNGYAQMTTEQRALYDEIWERSVKALDAEEVNRD